MKRVARSVLVAVLLTVAAGAAAAQRWQTYTNEEFDLQFELPGRWNVETEDGEVPSLLASSPDGTLALVVLSFKNSKISTEALLDQAVEELDMDVEGDAEEADLNGMHVWTGIGTGTVKGKKVGLAIQAMTYDDNNHIAYVFTEVKSFKPNARTMDRILDSFAPLK